MSDVKSKLFGKNRKTVKTVTIEADDVKVEVQIIKPTMGDRARLLDAAQKAGDLDADGDPTSSIGGARVAARMVSSLVYVNGQRYFTDDEHDALIDAPFFEDLAKEVKEVFSPNEEKLKGNS